MNRTQDRKAPESPAPLNPVISSVLSEFKVMRSVFKTKAQNASSEQSLHALREQESVKGIYLAILVLSLFEIPVMHVLLYEWRPSMAWWGLALSLYSVLYIYGLMRALNEWPTTITDSHLNIHLGLDFALTTPLSNVSHIGKSAPESGPLPEGTVRTSKSCKPTLVIHFHQSVNFVKAFGKPATCQAVALSTTDDATFLSELEAARRRADTLPGREPPLDWENTLPPSQETS